MLTLEDVKRDPQVQEFISQTEQAMEALKYTNHGLRHSEIVATRCQEIGQALGLDPRETELAAIAGYCHDMGNFLTRTFHHFFGATLFHQIFQGKFEPEELAMVMQAIGNHDKDEMNFVHAVSAILVLADKSDVDRSRVVDKELGHMKDDIHDRVNYAATGSAISVDTVAKKITLNLDIDTKFCPVMEYFEVFTERMVFCRKAAQFLGYDFNLIINDFELL